MLHTFFDYSHSFNSCAVGFSAVLFSLKYVWNRYADSNTNDFGISVPTKYAAWAELVMISLVTPNASFVGHLAGILAGVLYVHVPTIPMVRGFINRYGGADSGGGGYDGSVPSYTYASGYASASRSTTSASASASRSTTSASASASASVSPPRTSSRNPDYRAATGNTSRTTSSSSSSSSTSYPFPSAPPLPREYEAGDVLDVVYIDDIDEGVEIEEEETKKEVKVAARVEVGSNRTGNDGVATVGGRGGSNVIDLTEPSAGDPVVDSNEVRRRRLERFSRT